MKIERPQENEYPAYYETYIGKVEGKDLLAALKQGAETLANFLETIPDEKHGYLYAEGKWTIREIVGHLLDAERVFAYRALRFSRADKTPLAGFDENLYVPESRANHRKMLDLLAEFVALRASTVALFEGMNEEMTLRQGEANGKPISVRALGYIICGHEIHHMRVIQERYLG